VNYCFEHNDGFEHQPESILLILHVKQKINSIIRAAALVAWIQNTCLPTQCVGLLAFYPMGQPPPDIDIDINILGFKPFTDINIYICLLTTSKLWTNLVIFHLFKVFVVAVRVT